MADTSSFTRRYNTFTFTEGANDAVNGSLLLGAGGQYEYFVYEQVTGSVNLDPTGLTLVESGLMELDRGNTTYVQHTITETYTSHSVT